MYLALARALHAAHVAILGAVLLSPLAVWLGLIPWQAVLIAGGLILAVNVRVRRRRIRWGACPLTQAEYWLLERATGERQVRRSLMGRVLGITDERLVSRIMLAVLAGVCGLALLMRGV